MTFNHVVVGSNLTGFTITGVWCNGSTEAFEAFDLGPIPNAPAMGVSYSGSTAVSKTAYGGSIPSTPAILGYSLTVEY